MTNRPCRETLHPPLEMFHNALALNRRPGSGPSRFHGHRLRLDSAFQPRGQCVPIIGDAATTDLPCHHATTNNDLAGANALGVQIRHGSGMEKPTGKSAHFGAGNDRTWPGCNQLLRQRDRFGHRETPPAEKQKSSAEQHDGCPTEPGSWVRQNVESGVPGA